MRKHTHTHSSHSFCLRRWRFFLRLLTFRVGMNFNFLWLLDRIFIFSIVTYDDDAYHFKKKNKTHESQSWWTFQLKLWRYSVRNETIRFLLSNDIVCAFCKIYWNLRIYALVFRLAFSHCNEEIHLTVLLFYPKRWERYFFFVCFLDAASENRNKTHIHMYIFCNAAYHDI